jgi:hypothetical protein
MGFLTVAQRRFGIAGELLSFFWNNKRWWLLPVVSIILVLAVVLVLASNPAIAPFIYTLF